MTKRSVEQWQALFKQHDESGLKSSEFCRANNDWFRLTGFSLKYVFIGVSKNYPIFVLAGIANIIDVSDKMSKCLIAF